MAAEGTELVNTHGVPAPLWRRIVDDPERAPEMLALAASERFAGPAQEWVAEHEGKKPKSLAKKAFRRHIHMSRAEGLALGLGGIVTSAANIAGLGWLQARMVFFIAAAYGNDPRDPMRPAELLWLWGVYDSVEAARASLDGVGESMASTVVKNQLSKQDERSATSKLVRYVGKRTAKRYGGRLIPGLGAPISAVQNGGSTKELGRAAIAFYGEQR